MLCWVAVPKKAAVWRKMKENLYCLEYVSTKQTVCELVQITPFLTQPLSSVQLSKINFRLHLSQNILS